MFCGPCIPVYLYNKGKQDAIFTFILIPINNLYMFRAGLLLIIRWNSTPIVLAASRYKRMTYTNCCIYRIVPPDEEQ
jgi:hypothetical protein